MFLTKYIMLYKNFCMCEQSGIVKWRSSLNKPCKQNQIVIYHSDILCYIVDSLPLFLVGQLPKI